LIDVLYSVATHHTEAAAWRLNADRFEQTVVGLVCGISLIGQMLAVYDYADPEKQRDEEPSKAAGLAWQASDPGLWRFGDCDIAGCSTGGSSLGKVCGGFAHGRRYRARWPDVSFHR
jgi:hypothetical protein